MIWTILKVGFLIAIAAILAFLARLIISTPGNVSVIIGDEAFSFSLLGSLLTVAALFFAIWVAYWLAGLLVATYHFFNGDNTAYARFYDRRRERKGYDALSKSLVALAEGDNDGAVSNAKTAHRLLDRPDMTHLVKAQAAQKAGDSKLAYDSFKAMLENDQTRFIGVAGLLNAKLEEGDKDTALALAEKAAEIKPTHKATLDTLFKLQSEKTDWNKARNTLKAQMEARSLPRDVWHRRDAVLQLASAQNEAEKGNVTEALSLAQNAHTTTPNLVPAAVLAAELAMADNQVKEAERILKKSWKAAPHPDLAAAFAALAPDETPEERLKRFRPLLRAEAKHDEGKLLAAELHLAAQDYPGARAAMDKLDDAAPTARSLAIMAAIEKGEGAPENTIRGLLASALTAPRGKQWHCDHCKQPHRAWMPVCATCEAFDSISWQNEPQAIAESEAVTTAAMLPLIVAEDNPPMDNSVADEEGQSEEQPAAG